MELDANGIDVSEFFLVEYSADSEMGSANDNISKLSEPYYGLDNDDAESCICDSSSDDCLDWEREEVSGPGGCVGDEGCSRKSSCGIGCTSCRPDPAILGFMSEDEEEEMMWGEYDGRLRREEVDAMEDRLFWETCMAVGYPIT